MTDNPARTIDREAIGLDRAAINDLRARLRGPLVLPGETGYDAARSCWNGMIERSPALVARPLGTADVSACVNFAREHGLPLSIKGGGHNIAGLAVADGALLLDTSLMRGVFVDATARIARAQAGCLLGDLDRETQLHGLAAVLGFVSETGAGGLTLGGGFGYLSRQYGWTSDNVVSMNVVTADGRLVRASESENADLFWALRGGGGNFGVVTSFEHRLHPVGPTVMAGALAWRGEDAAAVLEMYRDFVAAAPRSLTCATALRLAPPAPWLPPEIHGRPIILLLACHTGPVDEGQRLVAPLKAFGSPVGDVLQPRPYTVQQSLLDATQPKGRRYYWKSEYLPGIAKELLPKLVDHAGRITSPHSAVILFQIDGAIGELPVDHGAVGNRDARVVLNITSAWEDRAQDEAQIGWARAAWRDTLEFSTGGTYVNFLNAEEGEDRIRAAYRDNFERLVAVKRVWDPDNFFRSNKNIAPG